MSRLLLTHATLFTLSGAGQARRGTAMRELGLISDGALVVEGSRIEWVGQTAHIPREYFNTQEIDCKGRVISPGFVDSHTHLLFTEPRWDEIAARHSSLPESTPRPHSLDRGIQRSAREFREASDGELLAKARRRLVDLQGFGTTTVEAKTGYGLTNEQELRALELLRRLSAESLAAGLPEIHPTLLAHVPMSGTAEQTFGWAPLIQQAKTMGARFFDVYCDHGAYTLESARRLLQCAQAAGLMLKVHAEQLHPTGAARMAAALGAVSVDHLERLPADDLGTVARSASVATLLPGCAYFTGPPWPPARELIDAGAAVALATDLNPGTCPSLSMPFMLSLACAQMKLTPAEAWTAATINGAAALGMAQETGSLQPGKRADLACFETCDLREVVYSPASNLCVWVMQSGRIREQAQ